MLDATQIDQLKLLLSTKGWQEVMRPVIGTRAAQLIKTLVLHPSERPEQDRDDSRLRGRIEELEWMLAAWPNEINVYEHNRRLDELDRVTEDGLEPSPANP